MREKLKREGKGREKKKKRRRKKKVGVGCSRVLQTYLLGMAKQGGPTWTS